MAAPSVTRTSSRARLRSIGVPRSRVPPAAMRRRSYGGAGQLTKSCLRGEPHLESCGPEGGNCPGGTADAFAKRVYEVIVVVTFVLGAPPEEAAGQGVASAGWIQNIRHALGGHLDDPARGDARRTQRSPLHHHAT